MAETPSFELFSFFLIPAEDATKTSSLQEGRFNIIGGFINIEPYPRLESSGHGVGPASSKPH